MLICTTDVTHPKPLLVITDLPDFHRLSDILTTNTEILDPISHSKLDLANGILDVLSFPTTSLIQKIVFFCSMYWYYIHFLVGGVSLYRNPCRCIFVVEDKHGFISTENISINEQFVHVLAEAFIAVFGGIFIFIKTDALSNFLQFITCCYSTNKGGF